jgi:hypothetical protein
MISLASSICPSKAFSRSGFAVMGTLDRARYRFLQFRKLAREKPEHLTL